MTIISYAQNFEDVMLWRCFKDIKKGFYIDIGANDPVKDSVSLLFYQNGWRGIHVEPTTQYSEQLKKARPEEVVKQIALGSYDDEITFYEFPESGLSTSCIDIAKKNEEQGHHFIETKVKQQRFDDAFSDIDENQDIHWLKIDVEGAEQQVLEGWSTLPIKPWVLVIESTLPLSQKENYDAWEARVLDKGYEFVYFDGLNRFYLSKDHPELKSHFNFPPNVFDDFIQNQGSLVQQKYLDEQNKTRKLESDVQDKNEQLINLENKINSLDKTLSEKIAEYNQLQADLNNLLAQHNEEIKQYKITCYDKDVIINQIKTKFNALQDELINHQTEIAGLLSSRSWRITKPLRNMSYQYQSIKNFNVKSQTKKFAKKAIVSTSKMILAQDKIKSGAVFILRKTNLYDRVKIKYNHFMGIPNYTLDKGYIEYNKKLDEYYLSASERKIYNALKDKI